jgi:bifunctional non-homologous end joining protein LigD
LLLPPLLKGVFRRAVVGRPSRDRLRRQRAKQFFKVIDLVAADAAALPCHNAIIDGEAVVLDAEGRASFSALQADLAGGGNAAMLYAFDCLFLDGRDLRKLPLSERRDALEALIGRPKSGAILFSDEFEGDGAEFWVRPELSAVVAYRGFTTAGELRHASFKGLREEE